MPQLSLRLNCVPAPTSTATRVRLDNRTDKTLSGTMYVGDSPTRFAPIEPAYGANLEIPAEVRKGPETQVTLALFSPVNPAENVRVPLTLPTSACAAFAIVVTELAPRGVTLSRSISAVWPGNPPEIYPTVLIEDDEGRVHQLTWAKLGYGNQGQARECLVRAGVGLRSLRVVGTCVIDDVHVPIGGKNGYALEIADKGAGLFKITRDVVPTPEEIEAARMAAEARLAALEAEGGARSDAAERARVAEEAFRRHNEELQRQGEANAAAASAARRSAAVSAHREVLRSDARALDAATAAKLEEAPAQTDGTSA